MALATRCPHCSTTFRVANDQLKLHAGLVRCGKCQQTFNGVENLVPIDAQGRALSQTLPAPQQTQSSDAHTDASTAEASPVVTSLASQTATPPPLSTQAPSAEAEAADTSTQPNAAPSDAKLVVSAGQTLAQTTAAVTATVSSTATKASRQTETPVAAAAKTICESQAKTPAKASETKHGSDAASQNSAKPEVWRHTKASSESVAAKSVPQSSATNIRKESAQLIDKPSARPIAKPIDSARLGDIWARQAEAQVTADSGQRLEPHLSTTAEPHLSASELEFDLSMPTRQFIDPATAEEWLKLEQASLAVSAGKSEPYLSQPEPQVEESPLTIDLSSPEPAETGVAECNSALGDDLAVADVPEASLNSALPEPANQLAEALSQDQADATDKSAVKLVELAENQATTNDQADIASEGEDQLLAKTVLIDRNEESEATVEAAHMPAPDNSDTSAETLEVATATTSPIEIESIATANETDEAEEPGFVLAAERAKRWSRVSTILMSLALLLLIPLLLAQLAYTGRNYLVQVYPDSKPYLLQACQYLQCQLRLPAQIDYVNIDSHELQAQLPEQNIYQLSLQVQNQSPFVQAWPHVELILHDKREKPVLRKVFTPADYLTSQELLHANEIGLAAKADASIKLYFEQTNTKAAGYHVSVFYP